MPCSNFKVYDFLPQEMTPLKYFTSNFFKYLNFLDEEMSNVLWQQTFYGSQNFSELLKALGTNNLYIYHIKNNVIKYITNIIYGFHYKSCHDELTMLK